MVAYFDLGMGKTYALDRLGKQFLKNDMTVFSAVGHPVYPSYLDRFI